MVGRQWQSLKFASISKAQRFAAGQTGGPDARHEVARGFHEHDSKSHHHSPRGNSNAPASAAVLDQIVIPQNRIQASASIPAHTEASSGVATAETGTNRALSNKSFQQLTAFRTASAANEATSSAAALRAPHQDHPVSMDASHPGQPNSNGNAEAARPPISQMAGLNVGKPIALPPMVRINPFTLSSFSQSLHSLCKQQAHGWAHESC